ncbi:MAG: CNNM domain-containing protein, partial [Pseudomonadota bacterium]
VIAVRYWGELGLAIAPLVLTIVMLIFSELTPKTLAAQNPEKIAFPAALILEPLMKLLSPLVWFINFIANNLLKALGVAQENHDSENLSADELRTVVNEAGALIPGRHRKMLLSILDLEKVTVDDIMVPRAEIIGIDLDDDWNHIMQVLRSCQHTRLLVFKEDVDNVKGFVHARNILHLVASGELDRETFVASLEEVYFVPEGTPLNTQLLKFQRKKKRIGLVVDEYGDIQGLVTLEDILEEIVGEFTTDVAQTSKDIHPQADQSYMVDGSANIRELNRIMGWNLPIDGPKTLSGLIIEILESIPATGTSLKIAEHPIEIIQVKDNIVKSAKIYPSVKVKLKR